jgi:hypothetical protein
MNVIFSPSLVTGTIKEHKDERVQIWRCAKNGRLC